MTTFKNLLRPGICLETKTSLLKRLLIRSYQACRHSRSILKGSNNTIRIGKHSTVKDCRFRILGSNNHIYIGANCILNKVIIDVISNHSAVVIGDEAMIIGNHMGFTHLLAKGDGTSITVGSGCLVSYGVEFRTTDSHSIWDLGSGHLVNPPSSIVIGSKVWVGAYALVLKGASIGHDSVIAARSIVTGRVESNIVAAGQPCKEIRKSVRWSHDIPQIAK